MREILFRGKRVDNGEWETGSLVRNCKMKYCPHCGAKMEGK